MTLDRWDDTAKITYDQGVWNELCSLRFVESGHNAFILGQVGVARRSSPPPLAVSSGSSAVRANSSALPQPGVFGASETLRVDDS